MNAETITPREVRIVAHYRKSRKGNWCWWAVLEDVPGEAEPHVHAGEIGSKQKGFIPTCLLSALAGLKAMKELNLTGVALRIGFGEPFAAEICQIEGEKPTDSKQRKFWPLREEIQAAIRELQPVSVRITGPKPKPKKGTP